MLIIIGFYAPQPLPSPDGFSIKRIENQFNLLKNMYEASRESDSLGNLAALNKFVDNTVNAKNIHKRSIGIYFPKDVINDQLIKNGDRRRNFYTMNIFAVTGVQIIRGYISGERAYGFANYDSTSLMTNKINVNDTCKLYNLKQLIIVQDYNKHDFTSLDCNDK
ncbi:hypothetical protein OFY05_11345 [Pseudocitrobacter faecalis]|nr:hypothetical protein OFY05_11345 [Pseudocitrobacter faecalis]